MNWVVVSHYIFICSILVFGFAVARAFRCVVRTRGNLIAVFFAAAAVNLFLNALYWVAYSYISPDTRMPFSAADFSENNTFLLLGSALIAAFPEKKEKIGVYGAGALLFVAANIALWIAWSGEWVKDILGGLCFGYMAYHMTRAMVQTGAFTRLEWQVWCANCVILLASLFAALVAPAPVSQVLETACFVPMFAGLGWFLVRGVLGLRRPGPDAARLSLAFAGYFWSLCVTYMCAEPAWFVAQILGMVMFLLLLFNVERQVEAA